MRRVTPAAALCGLVLSALVWAEEQETIQFVEVPPPPPMSSSAADDGAYGNSSEDELAPDVTIVQRKDGTYEEYRLNGRLYMVKVIPSVGPAYYYIDRDGDGLMESKKLDRAWEHKVPQWVLFSW
jgi:hypothetical protein